ncbi:MAG: class I tRNA ligase family protein, partial [Lachnospiraceae bacterium]|nr:class I tRNA ligase family protein [Lachnospiraceae bacterium]
LRMYELFVGPPELDSEWDPRGIDGVYRFLARFWTMVQENKDKNVAATPELERIRNKMIYDIDHRLNAFSLNTVISGFMEYNNKLVDLTKNGGVDKQTLEDAVVLLAPFAPHIAEELWQELGHNDSVFNAKWPVADASKMHESEVEIAVQINGKVKATITIDKNADKDSAIAAGKAALGDKLAGTIVKEIYVPGKIVNIVVKG